MSRRALLGVLAASGVASSTAWTLLSSDSKARRLLAAIAARQNAAARKLLDEGVDPDDLVDIAGVRLTPLVTALATENEEMREELAARGASLETHVLRYSPLEWALLLGRESSELRSHLRIAARRRSLGSHGAAWRSEIYSVLTRHRNFRAAAFWLCEAARMAPFSRVVIDGATILRYGTSTVEFRELAGTIHNATKLARLPLRLSQRTMAKFALDDCMALADDLFVLAKDHEAVADFVQEAVPEIDLKLNFGDYDQDQWGRLSQARLDDPIAWSNTFLGAGFVAPTDRRIPQDVPPEPLGRRNATNDENVKAAVGGIKASGYLWTLALWNSDRFAEAARVKRTTEAVAQSILATKNLAAAVAAKNGLKIAENAGDFLEAGIQLYLVLDQSGPDVMTVLLEQTIETRRQIENLRQELHLRFDLIHRQLNGLAQQLWSASEELSLASYLTRNDVNDLRTKLANTHQSVHFLVVSQGVVANAISGADLSRRMRSVTEHDHLVQKPLPDEQIVELLKDLVLEATDGARRVADLTLPAPLADDQLDEVFSKGAASFTHLRAALRKESVATALNVADPNHFILVCRQTLELFFQHLELARSSLAPQCVDRLLMTAESIDCGFRALRNGDLFDKLLDDYRQAWDVFRGVVKQRQEDYATLHIASYAICGDAYQPHASVERAGAFKAEAAAPRPNQHSKYVDSTGKPWDLGWRLPLPLGFENLIPPPFLMAHGMNLGTIEVFYQDADYINRTDSHDSDAVRTRGFPSLDVEVVFRRSLGDNQFTDLPILRKQLVVNQRVHFKIEHRAGWAIGNITPQGVVDPSPQPQWLQWWLQQYQDALSESLLDPNIVNQFTEAACEAEHKVSVLVESKLRSTESKFNVEELIAPIINETDAALVFAYHRLEGLRQKLISVLRLGFHRELRTDLELLSQLSNLPTFEHMTTAVEGALRYVTNHSVAETVCQLEHMLRLHIKDARYTPHPELNNVIEKLQVLRQAFEEAARVDNNPSPDEAVSAVRHSIRTLNS